MNISVSDLLGFKIQAEDGDIGSVDDVLFDYHTWDLRYLVVDTGGWLFGRKVLIPPLAAYEPDVGSKHLPVRMTKEQIKDSPDIASDPPVSREQEIAYYDYYHWPYYWVVGGNAGFGHIDGLGEAPPVTPPDPEVMLRKPNAQTPEERDYSLRSASMVMGYTVRHSDYEIGHVKDFLLDGATWSLPFMVVEMKKDNDTMRVLIPTSQIEKVGWPEKDLFIKVDPFYLGSAPVYDETVQRDPVYLGKVTDYFSGRVG
jgi:hypothetical protein